VNRRRLAAVLGAVLLALVFMAVSLRDVELTELIARLRQARPLPLLIYIATVPLHLLLRSWRWRSLLAPVRPRLPLKELFAATAIGYTALLVPGRLGEVVRPTLIHRRLGVPFAPALATIAIERVVLDLMALLLGGAVALVLPPAWSGLDRAAHPAWLAQLRWAGAGVLAFGLLALLGVHLLGRHRVRVAGWMEGLAGRAPTRLLTAVLRWLASLLPGFAALATLAGVVRIIGQTVLIWLVIAIGIRAGIAASGVVIPLPGVLALMPILALGISLPTPGGTGPYHLAMKLGLVSLFGVDATAAVGAGFLVHAFNWAPVIVMGCWYILRGGLRPAAATAEAEPARDPRD
jgi:hypothetical protein